METSTNKEGNLRRTRPSLLSSQISLALEKAKPVIPDGGWGWVVVFATFAIYAIAEGVSLVFGLLYVEFLEEFKSSKSATSWVGSLFMALPLIAGPICSALVDKFGCRSMTIIGSAICSLGFVLSSYAKSIGVLYVTFGVIGGLARGLVYITVVVSVAFWFEKKRSVALGISASGTGVGTVIFAPITAFLISEFRWRGAVLILSGFLLNMCVCGALMIDPKWVKEEEKKEKLKKERNENKTKSKEMHKLLKNDDSKPTLEDDPEDLQKQEKPASNAWSTGLMELLKTLSSFSLFLELHFFFLSSGILLAGTWFLVPYFYLADHMIPNGYTEDQASISLSVIGCANTLGMIILGWIGDRMNVAKLFSISLVLCGSSILCIMFFTHQFILLLISCASFGFFFASCFSLTPTLLAQLVSLDDFTMGYGLILLCEGSGHMIGPPVAGLVTDITGSWSMSFYLAGIFVVLSGVFIGLIPFTKNKGILGKKLKTPTENDPA